MSVSTPGPAPGPTYAVRAGAARFRAALGPLRRLARPAPDGLPPRPRPQPLSRWAWAADATTAVVLAAATAYATAKGASGDGPFRSQTKVLLRDGGPPPPVPPLPPVPRPGTLYDVYGGTSVSGWLVLLAALTALPLAVRRRWPLGAFTAVVVAVVAFHGLSEHTWALRGVDDPTVFTFVSVLIAAYAAALYSPYRRAAVVSLASGGIVVLVFHDQTVSGLTPGFAPFVLLVPLGLAANTVHTWRQRMRTMQAEQETATRLAVDKERARIARELHDVVTHNVSMMTVQAGAARTVLAAQPEQAREALLAVEAAGRAAMAELRHVMGLLSMATAGPEDAADPAGGLADGLAAELAPQPGLDQVGVLAERVRGTGVPVSLTVTGSPVPLPAGVDLAAYRVVQEALTNTVKHAAGASVAITVGYRPGEVRVEVADTGGVPSPAAGTGNGRGLMGLRERLAVYDGTLDAGRRVTGGFRVRAVIPVGEI